MPRSTENVKDMFTESYVNTNSGNFMVPSKHWQIQALKKKNFERINQKGLEGKRGDHLEY